MPLPDDIDATVLPERRPRRPRREPDRWSRWADHEEQDRREVA